MLQTLLPPRLAPKAEKLVVTSDRQTLIAQFVRRYASEQLYKEYADILHAQLRRQGDRGRTVDMVEYLCLLEDKGLMPAVVSKTEAVKIFTIVNR